MSKFEFNPLSGQFDLVSDLSGYVPYTGATSDVDLGSYGLTGKKISLTSTASDTMRLAYNSTRYTDFYNDSNGVLFIAPASTNANKRITVGYINDSNGISEFRIQSSSTKYWQFASYAGDLNYLTVFGTNFRMGVETGRTYEYFAGTNRPFILGVGTADSGIFGIYYNSTNYSQITSLSSGGFQVTGVGTNPAFNFVQKVQMQTLQLTPDTSVPGTLTVALAGLGAGNVDNGAHDYVVCFYTASGRSIQSAIASVTVTDKTVNGQVAISNIPISTRGDVIGRKIYRTTQAGSYNGANRWYLVTTIADNTTTTYTDNIADATINPTPSSNNESIFAITDPYAGSTWTSAIRNAIGNTTIAQLDSRNQFKFVNSSGRVYAGFDYTTSKFKLYPENRPKDANIGFASELYVANDVMNSNTSALYITPPSAGTRIFLGDATRTVAYFNMQYINQIESFPHAVAWSSANNTSYTGAYDTVTKISAIRGGPTSSYMIFDPGTFTSSFSGIRAATGMRSIPFTVNPTDGDGWVRNAGYLFNHENTSYVKYTSFTGTGLNNATIDTTLARTIGAENSGTGHTYDVKITATGTPDSFQYSIDGGAYNGVDIAITGANQTLANGVQIKFATTTGHTLNDVTRVQSYYWTRPHTRWALTNESTPLMDLSMTGGLTQTIRAAGTVGYAIKAHASQTANLQEWQNSAGTVLSSVSSVGKYVSGTPINLKGYTVATLPAGVQGDVAYVTDALAPTFLTAVVGGGAVVCPVFYNGAAWVAH